MATFTQQKISILAELFAENYFSDPRFNAKDKYEWWDLHDNYLGIIDILLERESSVFNLCRILSANNGSVNVNHVKRLLSGKHICDTGIRTQESAYFAYDRVLPEIVKVLNKYLAHCFLA